MEFGGHFRAQTGRYGQADCRYRYMLWILKKAVRGSVSRVLCAYQRYGGDHSSGMSVTEHLVLPTRATIRKQIMCRSYLVLLPSGFTLPLLLPAARCALTAPFHPYLRRGGLLSVALSLELPLPDVIRRRVSVEPGLSSLTEVRAITRPSDRFFAYASKAQASREHMT